jgi:hypothetical protein
MWKIAWPIAFKQFMSVVPQTATLAHNGSA